MRITAIATAFHPDERLTAVVAAARSAGVDVIVVDNTPDGDATISEQLRDQPGVRVLRSGLNAGLAGGLNAGLRALSAEAEAVLLLDQDSVLSREVVHGLAAHLADGTVGIAAPTPFDATHGGALRRTGASDAAVSDRDAVITSGMLVRRSVIDAFAPFREEFFVDHVDNDFCLRVRAAGIRIVQDRDLRLPHSLGDRQEHRVAAVTLHTSRHPTWRLYWFSRNGTVLVREHWRTAPRWAISTTLYLCQWLLARALLEPPRRPRIAAALRGFADGFRGRNSLDYLPAGASYPTVP